MKSPFTTTTMRDHHPKPNNNNTTTTHHPSFNTTASCYEPTSVLDIRHSPSPVATAPDSVPAVPGFFLDDHPLDDPLLLHHLPLFPSGDWDSLMSGFDRRDDSAPTSKTLPNFDSQNPNPLHFPPVDPYFLSSSLVHPDFNSSVLFPNQNLSHDLNPSRQSHDSYQSNSYFDCVQLDQLIRAAELFDSGQLQLAQVILERLNQRLPSPDGKPLQRAAFYFKEALQFPLTGSYRTSYSPNSSTFHKIKAYKAFCEISPITPFANFTSNQALLETLDGARFIHAIDFEIGLGLQWASFMQELANRSKDYNSPLSTLRVTAVVPEDSLIEPELIKDNLCQLADELGILFQIAFVSVCSFEASMFDAIRFIEGETIAVNLSPEILGHLALRDSVPRFFCLLRQIAPEIVLFVDTEGWKEAGPPSFRRNFINGLELYSSILESLDAANTHGLDFVRLIERYLLRPKIFAAVAAARNRFPSSWWELFVAAGMLPVKFSEFTECQAQFLVQREQARGFHVAKRQTLMLLCWQDRELIATSAWRC
ncbi:scarecrow-like protein 15 [Macadamia integrifolia]|uniref:scarecrow-like protein 15 n=1 Tax=Macadamia integrifolia TaxID=60698 RepID=UPI001C4F8C82|nr:scarecrow-like protein 15 [Macadamia integrifolia]